MKKLLMKLICASIMVFSVPFNVLKANDDIVEIQGINTTVNVNKTYPTTLYNNGCYSSTNIRLTGTYDISINEGVRTYSNIRLNATATGHPSDWTVEITGMTTTGTQSGLKVVIRYRFLTTRFDCPMTGGWFYDAITVTV